MAVRVREALLAPLDELRYEPTEKRVRAVLGGTTVADTTRALLVWEPRRIVPSYAVPLADVRAELVPAPPAPDALVAEATIADRPVLAVGGFAVHTTPGERLELGVEGHPDRAAALRPADADLRDHVVLEFGAFDAWYEEDEPIVGHPRDPFHRIDIRRGSRHVRIELDGELLAESTRPTLLFETNLPPRFYLPPDDVRDDLLRRSAKRTVCAYKGEASYRSVELGGRLVDDLAWSYDEPLRDAAPIAGLLAFFDEHVDVVVDGERRARPRTPWS
jgi:uncharacterized protein (DUF427 family)